MPRVMPGSFLPSRNDICQTKILAIGGRRLSGPLVRQKLYIHVSICLVIYTPSLSPLSTHHDSRPSQLLQLALEGPAEPTAEYNPFSDDVLC
jgi:hypothetical protein